MNILTTARTVSDIWDDAPSLFHIQLSASQRADIIKAHELAQSIDSICNIDLSMGGQTWGKDYEVSDLCNEDGEFRFEDMEDAKSHFTDVGMPAIVKCMENNVARMECMHVSVWQHGSVQFNATPKHCGDDMICYSTSLDIEDIKKGEIYVDLA